MFDKGRAEALSNKPKTSATFKITQRLQLFQITIYMQIYIYVPCNFLNPGVHSEPGPNQEPVKLNGSIWTWFSPKPYW